MMPWWWNLMNFLQPCDGEGEADGLGEGEMDMETEGLGLAEGLGEGEMEMETEGLGLMVTDGLGEGEMAMETEGDTTTDGLGEGETLGNKLTLGDGEGDWDGTTTCKDKLGEMTGEGDGACKHDNTESIWERLLYTF
jgi:hypothetical protein